MPQDPEETTQPVEEEVIECEEQHVADLDEHIRRFMSTFGTIRSKLQDLERAESDIKRFELSIEQERKRLQKSLETAKEGLRGARVQMAVELAKLDAAGFSEVAQLVKGKQNA